MNPARGFIIGIARKIGEPLIERTKCDFVGLPCWLSNLLKILSGHPYMLLSYAKDSQGQRQTFLSTCNISAKWLHT